MTCASPNKKSVQFSFGIWFTGIRTIILNMNLESMCVRQAVYGPCPRSSSMEWPIESTAAHANTEMPVPRAVAFASGEYLRKNKC